MTIGTEDLSRSAGDVGISLTSPQPLLPDLAAHLDDYLAGPIGELDLPGYQLNLWTQPDQYRTATAAFTENVTGQVSPVPGVTLTESRTSAGTRSYTVRRDDLEQRPGAWAVSINGTTIDLYVNGAGMAPRFAVRIIREAMLRTYENAHGIVFHAAGVDRAGSAVMICGPRSAGKTSTLTALLRALGEDGALLSNDRMIVHGDGRVVAVPLPVPLARGTIDAFPELRAAIPTPARTGLPDTFATAAKTTLAARPFAAALGSSLTAGSHLQTLLAPQFSDTAQPPRIRRLTEAETLALLTEECFTPTDEFWQPWLVERTTSDTALTRHAALTCEHLAATVPCRQLTFGVRGQITDLHRALADLTGARP
ncbi:hypothetical protein GCM10009555_053860 [Acrocarpospora macrocephala]|uniref:HPr kinase n=1 Tax=Acrocarpospora macrocephala TaxID=150177 RepID=A0A5M3WUW7_9ACTN|nr:hypothetical protein [Acrocarpospora macrocephala]GES11081.1 hypothetical protein Amac_046780 [Acrocarpospora macrocephala]